MENGRGIEGEWADEGKQNEVCAPEKALRQQSQHMIVCVRGRPLDTKPGGTAGDFYRSCPSIFITGTGAFFTFHPK